MSCFFTWPQNFWKNSDYTPCDVFTADICYQNALGVTNEWPRYYFIHDCYFYILSTFRLQRDTGKETHHCLLPTNINLLEKVNGLVIQEEEIKGEKSPQSPRLESPLTFSGPVYKLALQTQGSSSCDHESEHRDEGPVGYFSLRDHSPAEAQSLPGDAGTSPTVFSHCCRVV